MHRRPQSLAVFTLFLILAFSSATFTAQPAQPNHTLTFAELTHGTGITAMAADRHGGAWFGADTCSTTLPTTPDAVQRTVPFTGCHGLLGRMSADGAVNYLSYI